jgi:hypothetical protein
MLRCVKAVLVLMCVAKDTLHYDGKTYLVTGPHGIPCCTPVTAIRPYSSSPLSVKPQRGKAGMAE